MSNISVNRPAHPTAASVKVSSGILLMLLAAMCIALIDPVAKYAGRHLPVLQVIWARYAFGSLTAFILFRPGLDPRQWGIRRPWLQTLRAACLFGSTAFNFLALKTLGLVESQAIVMLGPIVISGLSIVIFRERLRLLVGLGLILGLTGAMIVIQPGGDVFKISALFAVGNVLSYASYVLLSKRLLASETMLSLNIVAVVLPAVALTIAVVPIWHWPDAAGGWIAMGLVGAIGGLGHFFLVIAHRHAPASTLAPLTYTQLCWALVVGVLSFGEIPALHTIVGAIVIFVSGGLIMASSRR
ncbi:DMT family transporter [Neorhizobium sp. DAR64861/K0K2]|uniref:DMT family transporter n=1 Tax=unclassified Neorhizobium TaxID=2629175 RepID=UPI003D2718C8